MKRLLILPFAALVFLCMNCSSGTPRAKHVIFLGFDAMSAVGIQRAETPTFNYMIENGAVSLDTRCCRETSSSQNWMSMVSGAPLEMTGVTSNEWELNNFSISPSATNRLGIFPTMFDCIRQQKPGARMEAYIEWSGETRMYDMTVFDKVLCSDSEKTYNADELLDAAFASYLENEPELLFVSIDLTDHVGHSFGHESKEYFDCVNHMDRRVGEFLKELQARKMLDDAVIIITADHGGINFGHGGDSMEELRVPVIMYGKGVTKGKFMEHANMIYDNAATVTGLLGVTLPRECRGRFIQQAFEPKTTACYVPVPLVSPFKGLASDGMVSITADLDGAEIYYTLDGSTPDNHSTRYEAPFKITDPCVVQAVSYMNGNYSELASNFIYPKAIEGEPCVRYKLYRNYNGLSLPDFTKFGRADAMGDISSFSLEELPVDSSEDHFAVIFTSCLNIGQDGIYVFKLSSDDGSRLIIDGECVIDNDGSHSLRSAKTDLELKKGKHIVKIEYFEDNGGQELYLEFGLKGMPLRPVLPENLMK